ncbi:hypothetical protein CCYA_CCYA19G4696 [Cyanidiococcus yangmingshanensis]|nr:hypothetical protein CCYA_CCYA19G4696 [Cyanidiococcus yangmingshanensis]
MESSLKETLDPSAERLEQITTDNVQEVDDVMQEPVCEELLAELRFLRLALDAERRESKELLRTLERERRFSAETKHRFERQLAAASDQLLQLSRLQRESEATLTRLEAELAQAQAQGKDAQQQLTQLQRELSLAQAQADLGKRALVSLSEKEALMHETAKNNTHLRELVAHLEDELKRLQSNTTKSINSMEPGIFEKVSSPRVIRERDEMQKQVESVNAELDILRGEYARAKDESARLYRDIELLHRLIEEQQRIHVTTQALLQDRYAFMRGVVTVLAEHFFNGSIFSEGRLGLGQPPAPVSNRDSRFGTRTSSGRLRRAHSA